MDFKFRRKPYYMLKLLSIFPLLILQKCFETTGFPQSCHSSTITKDFQTNSNEISGWEIITSTPFQSQGVGFETGKTVEIKRGGIYFVSCNLIFKIPSSNDVSLFLVVESRPQGSSLVAKQSSDQGVSTLKVSGLLNLNQGSKIHVELHSKTKSGIEIKKTSSFSICLVSLPNHYHGIQAGLTTNLQPITNKDDQLFYWEIGKYIGSFSNGFQGFISPNSTLIILSNGYYYISVNIIIVKGLGVCTYELLIVSNSKKILLQTYHNGFRSNGTTTVHLNGIVHLQTNDRISLQLNSDVGIPSFAMAQSSFSLGQLQSDQSVLRGLSLTSNQPYMITNQGWLLIDFTKYEFTKNGEGFLSNAGPSLGLSRFTATKSGFYLITSNIYLRTLGSVSDLRISCVRNGIPIEFDDGDLVTTMASGISRHVTLTLSGILYLDHGDYVVFYLQYPYANPWYIERGSNLAILSLTIDYPACSSNLDSMASLRANQWHSLDQWNFDPQEGYFLFGSMLNSGQYIALKSGIYLVSSSIIINNASNAIIEVSLATSDDITNSIDGFYAKETSVTGSITLKMQGTLNLEINDKLTIFVKVVQTGQFEVGQSSSFSAIYLGKKSLLQGFHTTLGQDIIASRSGWHRIEQWNDPRIQTLNSFSTDKSFSAFSGVYMAKIAGYYHVAFSVVLNEINIIEKETEFIAIWSINDVNVNHMLTSRRGEGISKENPGISVTITLQSAAVLKLTPGETLSVKIYSKMDSMFVIGRKSSLSVVLLNELIDKDANGLTAGIPLLSLTQKTKPWSVISGWTTIGGKEGRFQIDSNTQLLDGSKITINEDSLYYISSQLELHQKNNGVFKMEFLATGSTRAHGVCNEKALNHISQTVSCSSVLYLRAGTTLSIRVTSTSGLSAADLTSTGHLSVYSFTSANAYPTTHALLKKESPSTYQSSALSDWITSGRSRFLMGEESIFNAEEGTIKAPFDGWYFISFVIALKDMNSGILEYGLSRQLSSGESVNMKFKQESGSPIRSISMATSIKCEKGDSSEIILSSTNTNTIVSKFTYLSATYIPNQSDAMNYETYLTETTSHGSKHVIPIRDWKSKGITQSLDNFLATETSLYLLTTHITYRLPTMQSTIYLQVNIGGKQAEVSVVDDGIGQDVRTISLIGSLIVDKTSYISVQLIKNTSEGIEVMSGSSLSLVSIGLVNEVNGAMFIGKTQLLLSSANWIAPIMRTIYQKQIDVIENTAVVMATGLYNVVVNLMLEVQRSMKCSVALFVNGMLESLATTQEFTRFSTLTIASTIVFERGMYIEPRMTCDFKDNVFLLEGSNWHVLMIENVDGGQLSPLAPVLIKNFPEEREKTLQIGERFVLNCLAGGPSDIQYKWTRDNEVISGADKDTLRIFGSEFNMGKYQCEATANGLSSFSSPVSVAVFDNDECRTTPGICSEPNQTCINTIGSFKCVCIKGFSLRGGECGVIDEGPTYQISDNSKPASVAIRVLVPIICIILIFVVVLGFYTLRKHKKARDRRDRHHLTDIVAIPDESYDDNTTLPGGLSEFELALTPYDDDGGFTERTLRRDSGTRYM